MLFDNKNSEEKLGAVFDDLVIQEVKKHVSLSIRDDKERGYSRDRYRIIIEPTPKGLEIYGIRMLYEVRGVGKLYVSHIEDCGYVKVPIHVDIKDSLPKLPDGLRINRVYGNTRIQNCNAENLREVFTDTCWIDGDFSLVDNRLGSLEGCPQKISGEFTCKFNDLDLLEYIHHGPKACSTYSVFGKIGSRTKEACIESLNESLNKAGVQWPDVKEYEIIRWVEEQIVDATDIKHGYLHINGFNFKCKPFHLVTGHIIR